uniref:Uncharacterized protein n=1 Tax=Anguilla anguilla TaxID=7936 RepID=A0A0E9PVN5_ANGAN
MVFFREQCGRAWLACTEP